MGLADGLSFLHGEGVIHRDLKLENVLVASDCRDGPLVLYTVKITDFGLSKAVGDGMSEACSLVGSRPYTAPEVLEGGGAYDFRSDLWCLGVLLYVLLAGHFPFSFDHIAAGQGELDAIVTRLGASESARSVVAGLLQLDASKRLTLDAILRHDWLNDGRDSDTSERPPKRRHKILREAPLVNLIPDAVVSCDEVAAKGSSVHEASQQNHQASDVGEWLAYMYSLSKGTPFPTPLAPPPAPGLAEPSVPASAVQLTEVCDASLQPDVMPVYMVAPSHLEGIILGKAGAPVKQIAQTVGCKVRLSSRKEISNHLIIIIGNRNQCTLVQEIVHARLMDALRASGQGVQDQAEVVLLVRAEAAGVVIGKQGFVLEQIRKQSGAKVQILSEQLRGQRPCIIAGSFQSVLQAERHVFDLVRAVPVTGQGAKGI